MKILIFVLIFFGWFGTTADATQHRLPVADWTHRLPIIKDRTDLTVEEKIRQIAKEEGFKWPDYLVRLADCESKLGKYKHNKAGNYPQGSVDRGVFMINNYWHPEVSDEQAHDLEWATKWTIKRINAGFQHEWSCDKLAKR